VMLTLASTCSHVTAVGCTFDEDSDPSLCEYSQGEDDDFDWQLIRTYNSAHANTDLLHALINTVMVLLVPVEVVNYATFVS
ncbi:hypothetical protein Z043_123924, partial [Scleropages formosus]